MFHGKWILKIAIVATAFNYRYWITSRPITSQSGKYFGIERTTFLTSKNRIILNIWNKVKVNNHVEEVIDYIENS